jgi:DNA-binding MarR family transcriptional regulator
MTGDPLDDDLRRIGMAWRELRRGAAMTTVRRLLHTTSAGQLDPAQADALDLLAETGSLRMSELAERLRVDASTATRSAQRLVDAGLAERRVDPCDRRGVVLAVTGDGHRVRDEIGDRARRLMRHLAAGFTPDELAQLGSLMTRWVEALDAAVVDLEPAPVATAEP